jgi:hypothetical protein
VRFSYSNVEIATLTHLNGCFRGGVLSTKRAIPGDRG